MSIFTDLGKIVSGILSGLKNGVKWAATAANTLVNAFKTFDATPEGQAVVGVLEGIAETIIPPSLIVAFTKWFPVLLTDFKWLTVEAGKSNDQVIADFIAWFNTGITDPSVKASVAHVLNANITKFIADNSGESLPIQTALTIPQIVHDPVSFQVTPAEVESLGTADKNDITTANAKSTVTSEDTSAQNQDKTPPPASTDFAVDAAKAFPDIHGDASNNNSDSIDPSTQAIDLTTKENVANSNTANTDGSGN